MLEMEDGRKLNPWLSPLEGCPLHTCIKSFWEELYLIKPPQFWDLSLIALNTAAAAKSLQLCPTLCDPIDGSPPGPDVPGILQARTLEWVAISFCNARKWKVKVKALSRVRLLATPWTAAHQAPPSMGFSRQEYWSGVPLPSPALNTTWANSLGSRSRAAQHNNNTNQPNLKHVSLT